MIKWVSRRAFDKVERDWNYDASQMGVGGTPVMFDHSRVPALAAARTA